MGFVEYVLMHRNVPVMSCLFENDIFIQGIKIYNMAHVPIGVRNSAGKVDNRLLRQWWERRHVGPNRWNWAYIKNKIHCESPEILARIAAGCSLSDQYWIREEDSRQMFEDVSFFTNDFDSDLFDLFLFTGDVPYDAEFHSPTCVTGGKVPKAWRVENGKRVLYKAPGLSFDQEPYNECIASITGKLIGSSFVNYSLCYVHGVVCVKCDCMLKENEELVLAEDIITDNGRVGKYRQSDIVFYMNFAKKNGVRNMEKFISDMVLSDFLLRNTDRNWRNFGLIRDAETLKWLRPAPLFDFDSSLFFDTDVIHERSFCKSALTGASLYDDLNRYCTCSNLKNVEQFPTVVRKVLENSGLSSERRAKLQSFALRRVEMLKMSGLWKNVRK